MQLEFTAVRRTCHGKKGLFKVLSVPSCWDRMEDWMERAKYSRVSPAVSRADHHVFGICRVEEGNTFLTLSALLSYISLLCHTLLFAQAGLHVFSVFSLNITFKGNHVS